jgi:hypothetical protein
MMEFEASGAHGHRSPAAYLRLAGLSFGALLKRQVPRTITVEQAKGFSQIMVRAVLSGRGDEVLQLVNNGLASESVSVAKAILKG